MVSRVILQPGTRYVLTVTLVTRLILIAVVAFSLVRFPKTQATVEYPQLYANAPLLDGWVRWDALWYGKIATQGYSIPDQPADYINAAYFPLYPLLMRAGALLVGDVYVAGVLIANLALVGAMLLLFQLVRARFGLATARLSVTAALLTPFSFYFSAVYGESLLLLGIVLTFYGLQIKRYPLAALGATLALATKFAGITVLPVLAYGLWSAVRAGELRPRALLWTLTPLLGLGAYMLYLQATFGEPLAFWKAQSAWGGVNPDVVLMALKALFDPAHLTSGRYNLTDTLHLLVLLACLPLLFYTALKVDRMYALWGLSIAAFSLLRWFGMGRYLLVAFPLYIALALLLKRRPKLAFALGLIGACLQLLLAVAFAHWYWVA